jgi:hypothetical protein
MNTNQSSNSWVRNGTRGSFFRNMFASFVMIALLFTSLPARAALAAGGTTFNKNQMQEEWDNKAQKVHNNSIFYQRVRAYPSNYEDPNELATAHDILNNYGTALRNAQRILTNHAGFNEKGKVINENLADQSLKDLSENLRLMRVLKEQLDGLKGEYILLPMSAINTTTTP